MIDALGQIHSMRRMPLTPRERQVLECLRDEPEEELTWAKGGGWWLGTEKVGTRTVKLLLCKVYIRAAYRSNNEDYDLYVINEDGRAALEVPNP